MNDSDPYPQHGTRGDALPRRQTTQTNTPSPLEVSGASQRAHAPIKHVYFLSTMTGSTNNLSFKNNAK